VPLERYGASSITAAKSIPSRWESWARPRSQQPSQSGATFTAWVCAFPDPSGRAIPSRAQSRRDEAVASDELRKPPGLTFRARAYGAAMSSVSVAQCHVGSGGESRVASSPAAPTIEPRASSYSLAAAKVRVRERRAIGMQ
jgi:hypothetical protein